METLRCLSCCEDTTLATTTRTRLHLEWHREPVFSSNDVGALERKNSGLPQIRDCSLRLQVGYVQDSDAIVADRLYLSHRRKMWVQNSHRHPLCFICYGESGQV